MACWYIICRLLNKYLFWAWVIVVSTAILLQQLIKKWYTKLLAWYLYLNFWMLIPFSYIKKKNSTWKHNTATWSSVSSIRIKWLEPYFVSFFIFLIVELIFSPIFLKCNMRSRARWMNRNLQPSSLHTDAKANNCPGKRAPSEEPKLRWAIMVPGFKHHIRKNHYSKKWKHATREHHFDTHLLAYTHTHKHCVIAANHC